MSYETFKKNQKAIIGDCELSNVPSKVNYPETFTDRSDAVILSDIQTNDLIQRALKDVEEQINRLENNL